MLSSDRVTHEILPSFEIEVNDGLGPEARNSDRMEIKLTFVNKKDREALIQFLDLNENVEREEENILVFHGENAHNLARKLFDDTRFILPVDRICEFVSWSKDNEFAEKQIETMTNKRHILKQLQVELLTVSHNKDETEAKVAYEIEDFAFGNDLDLNDEFKVDHTDSGLLRKIEQVNQKKRDDLEESPASLLHNQVQQLRQLDDENKQLSQAIKKTYADIEKHIATRSKVTAFCNYVLSLVKKKEVKLPEKITEEELEAKVASIPSPAANLFLPASKLENCSEKDLKHNIDMLLNRFHEKKTIEERATVVAEWIAKKCGPVFKYALEKSMIPVEALISKAKNATESAAHSVKSSLFPRSEKTSAHKKSRQSSSEDDPPVSPRSR